VWASAHWLISVSSSHCCLHSQFIQYNTDPKSYAWAAITELSNVVLNLGYKAVDLVRNTQAVILAVALAILTVVVLCLLPPAILRVDRKKDESMDLLLTIPVQRVQEICAARMEQLTQMGLDADAAGTVLVILKVHFHDCAPIAFGAVVLFDLGI